MKRYTYFVSYTHSKGFGCIEIIQDHPIQRFDDIEMLCKKTIPERNGLEDITVLTYKLLCAGQEETK